MYSRYVRNRLSACSVLARQKAPTSAPISAVFRHPHRHSNRQDSQPAIALGFSPCLLLTASCLYYAMTNKIMYFLPSKAISRGCLRPSRARPELKLKDTAVVEQTDMPLCISGTTRAATSWTTSCPAWSNTPTISRRSWRSGLQTTSRRSASARTSSTNCCQSE